ncbi:helix-turn-helix domain-containing protein [Arthrobacter sp.]|uniref:PucR family transcriptional regulator n=1 Tax=Arthrobacter sp. TaxID=1667 RepID=UPI003390BA99
MSDVEGLQRLVDALAERLQRSIAIDDTQITFISVSRHFGDEDDTRVQFLLGRKVDANITDWVLSLGLERLETPYKLAANPELGLSPRLCVPIRYAGLLLGYMWLIDAHNLIPNEMNDVVTTAEAIGLILYRRELAHERRRTRVEGIVRELVSSQPAARARAADELLDGGTVRSRRVAAIVIRPATTQDQDDAAQDRLEKALASAAARVSATDPDGAVLALSQRHRLVLILTGRRMTQPDEMTALADVVLKSVAAETGTRCLAGLGAAHDELLDANVSYDQAVAAARAAQFLPGFGDIVSWDGMGIYALLVNFAPQNPELQAYPVQLLKLSRRKNSQVLLHTAETFLDLAGDIQATASALHVHRTTLYQRLARIEQLSGLDMSRGNDRLTLHLGIKLAHLTGVYDQLVSGPDSGP